MQNLRHVILVRDAVELLQKVVWVVAHDLKDRQRREEPPIAVDHRNDEEAVDHGLHEEHHGVEQGEFMQEAELSGDGEREEYLDDVRDEKCQDLGGHDAGLSLYADLEGVQPAAHEAEHRDVQKDRHRKVAKAQKVSGLVVHLDEVVPGRQKQGCGDPGQDRTAAKAVYVLAL